MLFVAGAAVSACTSDPLNQGARVTLRQWYHAYGEKGTQQAVERYAAEVQRRLPMVARLRPTPPGYGRNTEGSGW